MFQHSANKSSNSILFNSIIGRTSHLNKKDQSPNSKSTLSNIKQGKLTALKNSLRELDMSLNMERSENAGSSSVISPNASFSISPKMMRGDTITSEAS
jgi:hypothetical protein